MEKVDNPFDYSFKFELRINGTRGISAEGKEEIVVNESLVINGKDQGLVSETMSDTIVPRTTIELRLKYLAAHLETHIFEATRMLQGEAIAFSDYILGVPSELANMPMSVKFFRDRTEVQKKGAKSLRTNSIHHLERRAEQRFRQAVKEHFTQRYVLIKESVGKLVRHYKLALSDFKKHKPKGTSIDQLQREWKREARKAGAQHPDEVFELVFAKKPTAEIARYLLGLEVGYEANTIANELKPNKRQAAKIANKKMVKISR